MSQNYIIDEENLKKICAQIEPVKKNAGEEFASIVNKWLPSEYGLGALMDLAKRYISVVGMPVKTLRTPFTAIFCADHGVAAENVSAYPPETTLHMATNYVISKGAAANAFSNFVNGNLVVLDMGINADTSNLPINSQAKIAHGTKNSAQGPAMTREEALKSLFAGISTAAAAAEKGHTIILAGEMGISNTTASAAITAAMCHLSPEQTTGRGTNISEQRLRTKIGIVKKILEVNAPDSSDPLDVLAKVGGFELGAIAGLIIGAAHHKALVILDGFNTAAAALIAVGLCPHIKDYLAASHIGGEQGHKHVLKALDLKPIMKLDLKLSEAVGSSIAADLLTRTLVACSNLTKNDDVKMEFMDKIKWSGIPKKSVTLTDKTFNYYTSTMPDLDRESMEACQERIDNLAKPIYSLGILEKIALQLSGIIGNQLPKTDVKKTLLLFGLDKLQHDEPVEMPDLNTYDELAQAYTFDQATLIGSFAMADNIKMQACHIMLGHTQMDAFEYGRLEGEKLALHNDIIGLGMIDGRPQTIEAISAALLDENGNLRHNPTNFLNYLDEHQQLRVSAVLGAMVAAAHNHTLVVLDDTATVAVARYAVQMLPDLEPFLLPIQPNLYQMNIKASGITALAGIQLITASLHMLNDMKTFTEARVAVANDGPGKDRQVL